MRKLVNQGTEGTSRNQNKTLSFFKKGAMIALSLSLVLSTYGPSLSAVKIADAVSGSGSIKTTDENCVAVNANQYYGAGEHVWLHGTNFGANTSLAWDIDSIPPTTAVASGNVLTDGSGSFCFDTYTISANDSGEYKATVDGKHDNYKVKGNDNPGGGDEGDPDPTPQTEDATPNPEVACGVNGILNSNFETPVVANEQNWDIYDSASSGIGWKAVWRDAAPTTFNSISKPIPTKIELQRFVNSWSAQDGHQYTELDSDWDGPTGSSSGEPGSIILYQYLNTTNGATYNISFYTSPRPGTGTAENNIKFDWNSGAQTDTIVEDGTSNTNTVWTLHSYSFTATGPVTRIAFTDMGTSNSIGGFLDDVKVVQECAEHPEEVDPTFNLHLLKQVCDNYGDVVGNPSKEVADDTGGHFNELAAGDITKPISPAEFAGNENCDSSNGWSFKLSTDQSQTQNVQIYGPTAGAGEFVIAYADLTPALQNALTSGNQIWVSEIIPDNTTANFAAMRCYMDALNGDNLEYITVNPHHIPENVYCIAYNITTDQTGGGEEEHPHDPNFQFNFFKEICSAYTDIVGNADKANYDATGGHAAELANGPLAKPVTSAEFSDLNESEKCHGGEGYTFTLSASQSLSNPYITSATNSSGQLVVTYAELPADIKNTLISGGQVWVKENLEGHDVGFGAIRCYMDALNGDNLEFITVNPNVVPSVTCIAYNVTSEGNHDPEAKHITGQKFNDVDGQGDKDLTDPGLQGWTIYAGQLIDGGSFDVSSSSDTPVTITGLQNGQTYFMRVTGTFDAGDGITADAQYSTKAAQPWTDLVYTYEAYGPELLDLQINNSAIDWGTFNTSHTYWHDFVSSGADLNFKIYDTFSSNNVGSLHVNIYKVVASDITDADGNYDITIPDNAFGGLIVAEQTQNGWVQTSPAGEGFLTVPSDSNSSGEDFGNHAVCESQENCTPGISGYKFNDLNSDGLWNTSNDDEITNEPGIAGWTIYLDLNNNGALDDGEPYTLTDENGFYSFTGLATGTYYVREVLPSTWTQITPEAGFYKVTVLTGIVGGNDFGNKLKPTDGGGCSSNCEIPTTYKISGFVYSDLEPDATKNNSDTGLQSWVVYIDTNDNHALDGSEVSTLTAADGSYSFTGLANGTYNIREVQDSGWTQTEPVSPNFTHVVLVASADVSDSNFGNHQNPNNGGGGGGGGGGSGGGSGGGGGAPLNPQVLGANTGNPGLTMGDAPTPQVLGESTELPRTGSSTAFLFVVFVAVLALRKRFQEAMAQSA